MIRASISGHVLLSEVPSRRRPVHSCRLFLFRQDIRQPGRNLDLCVGAWRLAKAGGYKRTVLKMKPTTSASASSSPPARSARSRGHARPRAGPQAASSPRPTRRPPKARAATWTSRSEHRRREGPSQSKGQLPPQTHIGDEWSQPPWQPPQGALSAQIRPAMTRAMSQRGCASDRRVWWFWSRGADRGFILRP